MNVRVSPFLLTGDLITAWRLVRMVELLMSRNSGKGKMSRALRMAASGMFFLLGVQAQDLRITSFQSTGQLAWSNSAPGSCRYQIEWAPGPNGPWTNTWDHLTDIESTQATNSVSVPMCYRVVWTDTTVADSVKDFSATQGSNNWFYGYYSGNFSPSGFIQMTNFVRGSWSVLTNRYWTILGANGGHPNGTITSQGRTPVEQWAVRRWVSNIEGPVTIRGVIADADYPNFEYDNGVCTHVFIDGVEKGRCVIDRGGAATFSIPATLANGAILDFALDPRESDDRHDTTTFTIGITKAALQ